MEKIRGSLTVSRPVNGDVCVGTLGMIYQPWPELQDYAMSFDLNRVDDFTHHHIPYGEAQRAGGGGMCVYKTSDCNVGMVWLRHRQ
eukprot:scaffold18341_cov20-Tisochrysis_lutea.AAC.1